MKANKKAVIVQLNNESTNSSTIQENNDDIKNEEGKKDRLRNFFFRLVHTIYVT